MCENIRVPPLGLGHHQPASVTFRWRAYDGPLIVVFGTYLHSSQNFLDPRMPYMHKGLSYPSFSQVYLNANNEPDHLSQNAPSDLGLHCLPMSRKTGTMLK